MAGASFWSQFKALVWKNVLLKRRNLKQTLQELLLPIYYIAILAMIKGLIKPTIYSQIQSFRDVSLLDTTFLDTQKTNILVVPDSQYSRTIMQDTLTILTNDFGGNVSFNAHFYKNESEAVRIYKAISSTVFAGVIFEYNSSTGMFKPDLSYAIRMPFSNIASTKTDSLYTDQSGCRQGDGLDSSNCAANTYLYHEFSTLQVAIDTALMRNSLNKTDISVPGVQVQMMPKPGFTPNVNYIQVMGALFFVIAFSPFVNFLTVNLVHEKEKKIKEGMKMMGLRDAAFWMSWSFVYVVMITVVTLVVIVIALTSHFFARSNMFVFFLMLLLYGLTIIGASFAVTPFFNKAQVAGGMASLASLLISMLYLIISLTRTYTASGVEYTIPVWGRWLLCLLSPVAIALATDQAIYLDIVNPDGMTFSTLTVGEFPAIIPLLMLVLDTVLYFLLAVYLDNVVPGEYGPRYPPWYIFSPRYWCRGSARSSCTVMSISNPAFHGGEGKVNEDENVESVPEELQKKVAVRIDKLTKIFSSGEETVTAVNDLSLDIYEGQITAILGHNGAGKTTTMNILTGLTGATCGTATIKGLDVSSPGDIGDIRSMTGVCPQHNILWDDLTCLEHLELFAGIKGIPAKDRDQEIGEALSCVRLEDQRDVRASALSGGQKRKLSVAIAVMGDPKIIFLDEPTAGMDPYSRRQLWSTLKKKKKGRVILLTTHFMDEADILADRKAILNKGSLRCCGSSLFLKNRFGIGYHLNMVVGKDCKTEEIKRFVWRFVGGAELNRVHGQELDITLPLSEVSNFAALFNALEKMVAGEEDNGDTNILSYGVSMTTLEEVFLELEKDSEVRNQDGTRRSQEELVEVSDWKPGVGGQEVSHDLPREQKTVEASEGNSKVGGQDESTGPQEGLGGVSDRNHIIQETARDERPQTLQPLIDQGLSGNLLTGWQLSMQRLKALLKIRFLVTMRVKQLFFFQWWQLSIQRLKALLKIRFLVTMRVKQLLFFQCILPVILLVVGLVVSKNSIQKLQGGNPPTLQIGPFLYGQMKGIPPVFGPYGPAQPLLTHDNVGSKLSSDLLGNISAVYNTDTFNISTPLLSVSPHYMGVNLTQFDLVGQNVALSYTALYNDSAVHSIPALVNLFSNVLFKVESLLMGKADNSSMIGVSSLPWPTNFEQMKYSNASFSAVILLAMAYILIPGALGVEVVKHRQDKVRSQLRISGVPFWIYWGAFFIMDTVKFLIPAVLMIAVTFIIKVPSLEQGGAVITVILLFLTYIPAGILTSYLLSFAFDKTETAQAVQPLIIFFAGFLPYMPVALVDASSSESMASLLHLAFCVTSPPYTVFGGLFYIDKVYRVAEMKLATSTITLDDYFTKDILVAIIVPILHAVSSFVLIRILDVRDTGGSGAEAFGCQATRKKDAVEPGSPVLDDDEDVREERERIKSIQMQSQQPVAYVSDLCKEFSKDGAKSLTSMCKKGPQKVRVAVSNSSFAVESGEVLGLLGPNGAGKSTTLAMMTADVTPTRGQVKIGGHDIRSSISEAFQAMGYCPQYDALWDIVTLREHLECYARIKGIRPEHIEKSVDFYMTNLRLDEHQSKHAKKLSGGTKRKLSYCMSMLGSPRVVLLDEPSTGMDPQSKRFLWDTISQGFRGTDRGAILTTHYMEEADVLCSRIAIMVNGKIRCLGSSQHLKNKYGSGYLLEVKLKAGSDDANNDLDLTMASGDLEPRTTMTHSGNLDTRMGQLKRYIDDHFPDAICVEEFSERAQFKIPRGNVTSLAKAFTALEEGKQHTDIEEYSFSQATLEQVFLDFAKQQLEEGEEIERGPPQPTSV